MNAASYRVALRDQFPELRSEFDDPVYEGLTHLETSCLARFAQAAVERKDRARVERCIAFVHRALAEGDADVVNAIVVSFLENLTLEAEGDPPGIVAGENRWVTDLMSPELRCEYDGIMRFWRTGEIQSQEPHD